MDGMRVQYSSEYILLCKKGTLKNQGEIFLKICQIIFEKNVAKWKWVGLNLRIFLTEWQCSNICLDKLRLRIF